MEWGRESSFENRNKPFSERKMLKNIGKEAQAFLLSSSLAPPSPFRLLRQTVPSCMLLKETKVEVKNLKEGAVIVGVGR